MRSNEVPPRVGLGVVIGCLVVSTVTFAVAMTMTSMWALSESFSEATPRSSVHVFHWIYAWTAAMQLVLAGPICRTAVQRRFPKSRRSLDMVGTALTLGMIYYSVAYNSLFAPVALGFLGFTVGTALGRKDIWLRRLSFAWAGAVVLVLIPAAHGAAFTYSVLWGVTALGAIYVTWSLNRVPKVAG
jgi:hypothetical protein